MKKTLLYLSILLFTVSITAQTNPPKDRKGRKFPNATEVTTAARIPVFDSDNVLNYWINPSNLGLGGSGTDTNIGNTNFTLASNTIRSLSLSDTSIFTIYSDTNQFAFGRGTFGYTGSFMLSDFENVLFTNDAFEFKAEGTSPLELHAKRGFKVKIYDTGGNELPPSVGDVITATATDGSAIWATPTGGTGSTDYVSNVALSGTDLNFTKVGNAFSGSVDLSSIAGIQGLDIYNDNVTVSDVTSIYFSTDDFKITDNSGGDALIEFKEGYTDIDFKHEAPDPNVTATLNFETIPTTSSYNFVSDQNLTAVKTGSESYATAFSSDELNYMITSVKEWNVVGLSNNSAIIVAITGGNVGKVGLISATGDLTVGSVTFPTTVVPSGANRIRWDLSTDNIIIDYSTDTGATWINWASVAKSSLPYTYTTSTIGVVTLGSSLVIYDFEKSASQTIVVDGDTITHTNLPVSESLDEDEDYLIILNDNEVGGAKKQLVSELINTPFSNLSAATYGDSITANTGTTAGLYQDLLEEKLGLTECTEHGYGSHSIGASATGTLADSAKLDLIIAEAPELVVVWAGTNDYGNGNGTTLGTADSTDSTTTAGGLRYILNYLQTSLPTATIVVCTPTPRKTQTLTNSLGNTLEDYVDIIKDVAGQLSVPVIDLFRVSGFAYNVTSSTDIYLSDSVHLSDAGADRVTSIQANHIKLMR